MLDMALCHKGNKHTDLHAVPRLLLNYIEIGYPILKPALDENFLNPLFGKIFGILLFTINVQFHQLVGLPVLLA